MKPISVHVDEKVYEELKRIASRRHRPVAEEIREAMAEYVVRERRSGPSLFERPPAQAGEQLSGWSRSDLFDDMIGHAPDDAQ
jgi:hypothetical protein